MRQLQATLPGSAQQGRAGLPAPAAEQPGMAEKLGRLRTLMASAQEREKKTSRAMGWGEGGSISKMVPTDDALRSHEQALSLAREILAGSDDATVLDGLRSILSTHPMRDVDESHGFRGSAPPLVDEVDRKAAELVQAAAKGTRG